jgi:broad specificity phosphatase PhoE
VEPALRGCRHGRWSGLGLAEAQAMDGEAALLAWLTDPAAAPHGGESFTDVMRRVGAWLDDRAQDGGHGVAVSHPEVARSAVLKAIGGRPDGFARIDAGPLARVVLTFDRGWRLRAIVPAFGIGSGLRSG